MHKFLALVVFIILLVPSTTYANLLINPGFETGDFSGWSLSGGYGSLSINNWGHSGNYSAAAMGSASGYQEVYITNPDLPTKMGGWVSMDQAGNSSLLAQIMVLFRDANNYTIGSWMSGYFANADNSWYEITTTLVPSEHVGPRYVVAGAAITWMSYDVSGSGVGTVNFDDLEISPVPEPASLLLLGSGLIGLLGLRKRTAK